MCRTMVCIEVYNIYSACTVSTNIIVRAVTYEFIYRCCRPHGSKGSQTHLIAFFDSFVISVDKGLNIARFLRDFIEEI